MDVPNRLLTRKYRYFPFDNPCQKDCIIKVLVNKQSDLIENLADDIRLVKIEPIVQAFCALSIINLLHSWKRVTEKANDHSFYNPHIEGIVMNHSPNQEMNADSAQSNRNIENKLENIVLLRRVYKSIADHDKPYHSNSHNWRDDIE